MPRANFWERLLATEPRGIEAERAAGVGEGAAPRCAEDDDAAAAPRLPSGADVLPGSAGGCSSGRHSGCTLFQYCFTSQWRCRAVG